MSNLLVDSCVLLDLFTDDPMWAEWSETRLEQYSRTHRLCINPIVYAEISIGFGKIDEVDAAISQLDIDMLVIPHEALFLAGKVFLQYRRNNGSKTSPLPDFFIGAHAVVSEMSLITRDTSRYKTYFPQLNLIHPA